MTVTGMASRLRTGALLESKESPFVSIALITFNKKSTIQACLESLYSLDYPRSRYEVVVVDGGSNDGTLSVLRSYPLSIIIETRKNRGLARNTAIEHSKGDIIAFIDADCLAEPSWLKEHVLVHEDPKVLIVGGSVLQGGDLSLPARIYHETYFAAQSPTLSRRVTWDLATCNASFKRNTFWQVGLFPEIERGEDSLLCWQTLRKGYTVLFDPGPAVVHLHEQISFPTLFKRNLEQGYADREIQQAFGSTSPFKLPRRFVAAALLAPSLVLARFGRYFTELFRNGKGRVSIITIPVLIGISILWTAGYLSASRRLGGSHGR
jgi:glycosyltransferase involved in cell wall biosynthesis